MIHERRLPSLKDPPHDQMSLTLLWDKLPPHHASRPPPSYLCQRSPHRPARMTIVQWYLAPSSWSALNGESWHASNPFSPPLSSPPPGTLTSLHTGPNGPLRMQYALLSIQLSHTWTKKTRRWGCCSLTLVQYSTPSPNNNSSANVISRGSTPRCVTGRWTFWVRGHKQYGSATTPRAASHWAQGPLRAVCSAHCSSPRWPTTVNPSTAPVTWSSWQTTQLRSVSSPRMMRAFTGRRSAFWPRGAETTTSFSTTARLHVRLLLKDRRKVFFYSSSFIKYMLSKCPLSLSLTVYCLHFITLSLYNLLLLLFTIIRRTKRDEHTFDFLYLQNWKIDNKYDFD